jgi:hypothetical protein
MPTAAELRESAEQVTARLQALTIRSMQQVRGLVSRGIGRAREFTGNCRGWKSEEEGRHWSTSSASDRNSQNRDSSKATFGMLLIAHVEREVTESHALIDTHVEMMEFSLGFLNVTNNN